MTGAPISANRPNININHTPALPRVLNEYHGITAYHPIMKNSPRS
jgi:hypothetical protein